jgi:threonine dehydrogenase-like Zn-dependent dehydrogenase
MPSEIVFPAKNTFELAEYSDAPLAADEIRGETVCSLISQGTELAWAGGDDFPIRPGYGAIFRVGEVGADVSGVTPGELRFCMGYHRSTQQYPARYTLPVPEGLAAEKAVVARLMGVSMTTLMTTAARPGDKVIVSGAGPVGICAAHNFQVGGYDVSVVEPNDLRRSQIEASGIASTFTSMPLDDTAFSKKVRLVVDCSGHEGAVLDACNIVGHQGEVVLVGVPWKAHTSRLAHEILNAVFFNFVVLRSGWEWEVPILARDFVWEELYEGYNNAPYDTMGGLKRTMDWLAAGKVSLEGLTTRQSPADPSALYDRLMRRDVEEPFVILDWRQLQK